MGNTRDIAIINHSTVLTDAQISAIVPALQKQVSQDLAPVWDIDAHLEFIPKGHPLPANSWWLVVLDNPDQAGVLGYHDLTNTGMPLGKVFAKADIQYRSSWSVTISHELLEMLTDPMINLTAMFSSTYGDVLYAYEVCDACESDALAYRIDDVLVSDFVYPGWLCRAVSNSKMDHCGHITRPLQLAPGGYISCYRIGSGKGWQQIHDDKPNLKSRAPMGSRRNRRNIPQTTWLKSSAHGENHEINS